MNLTCKKILSFILIVCFISPALVIYAMAENLNLSEKITELEVLSSTNGYNDIADGDWFDSFGNKYSDSLRFWVIHKDGYTDTESICYDVSHLGYHTLHGTIVAAKNCEKGAKMQVFIAADGKQIYSSGIITEESNPSSFSVDISGCSKIQIKCKTSTKSSAYCIVDAIVSTNKSSADAGIWYCPNCGRENNGNYCPKDGTAKPLNLQDETGGTTSNSMGDLSGYSVGDTIMLGSYEQDNNKKNGAEDIEWVVLANENDRLLVISKYILDEKSFDESESRDVGWENSTLREWLNNDFLTAAFTKEEQNCIEEVTVAPDCTDYDGYSCEATDNSTEDKIFLLSMQEVNEYLSELRFHACGPEETNTFTEDNILVCAPTEFSIANGSYVSKTDTVGGLPTGSWWTRTVVSGDSLAWPILQDGTFFAPNMMDDTCGVRPAMWIK